MSRPSLVSLAFVCSIVGLAGCGGSKSDFSVLPQSYTMQVVSPKDALNVTVAGVSRDGRVIGTYTNNKLTTVYGWTPDGDTADITLPTECKEVDGINELGGVLCSDRKAVPNKLFRWENGGVDAINTPPNSTVDGFGNMTFDSFFLVNLHQTGTPTRGYQLQIDQAPKLVTTDGGQVNGSSLGGNIAGMDKVGTDFHAIAVIEDKKVDLGLLGGQWTTATSVNDGGMVVGNRFDNAGASAAFSWTAGKFKLLPLPIGATKSFARDVNNGGVVAGSVEIAGLSEACIWFPGQPPVLVKTLAKPGSEVHLDRVDVVTPLGIVVCEGTKTTAGVASPAVFGLFPVYP